MVPKNSPLNDTSADFEKAAIARFRFLATCIPEKCKVFREPWGHSTVICLDFQDCLHLLEDTKEQINLLIIAAQQLELAKSLIFRIGNKVIGWRAIASANKST
jgi:hypothetical protein